MRVRVAVQRGPMGRTLHREDIEVPEGQERYTSTRVTVSTEAGPVELAVWPDGAVSLGTRQGEAGTAAGRKYHNLYRGRAGIGAGHGS